MAIIKCKMCGGDLALRQGSAVAECEYCGTLQTVPSSDSEKQLTLHSRANNLRLKCEFDKAEQLYERILEEHGSDPEAHWGIVLCKYGIEYVEDPETLKRIPTCHRASYDSITADVDYLAAVANADPARKAIYEAEAAVIESIQRETLRIVKSEQPFDVFLCYKETDENGKRTMDSVIANQIYYELTGQGLKVFYAAITLEDKLGREYEPYIFAALNSAKVMLVIGTRPEYFTAVWVKNEWSRFLKLVKTDRSKLLIPCYRDMDAYELPDEFAHLQAQDMSKIGFINDIVRGIQKVIVKPVREQQPVQPHSGGESHTAALLKRAFLFLEDGDWASADEYCEKVLDQEPENARAYLGKLMVQMHARRPADLERCQEPFEENNHYRRILRYGDEVLIQQLRGYNQRIKAGKQDAQLEASYRSALERISWADAAGNTANAAKAYQEAAQQLMAIKSYRNSENLAQSCMEKYALWQKSQEDAAEKKKKRASRNLMIAGVVCVILGMISAISAADAGNLVAFGSLGLGLLYMSYMAKRPGKRRLGMQIMAVFGMFMTAMGLYLSLVEGEVDMMPVLIVFGLMMIGGMVASFKEKK